MTYGYVYSAKADTNDIGKQLEAIRHEAGDSLETSFIDSEPMRTKLKELLSTVKDGDAVITAMCSNLADNPMDSIELMQQFIDSFVHVKVLSIGDIPNHEPMNDILFSTLEFCQCILNDFSTVQAKADKPKRKRRCYAYSDEEKTMCLELLKTHTYQAVSDLVNINAQMLYKWVRKAKEDGYDRKNHNYHYSEECLQNAAELLKTHSYTEVSKLTGIDRRMLYHHFPIGSIQPLKEDTSPILDEEDEWGEEENSKATDTPSVTKPVEKHIAEECVDIRFRLYGLYQLDWMMMYGHSLDNLMDAMDTVNYDGNETCVKFNMFERKKGFEGKIYKCFRDFLTSEYCNGCYMHSLLDRLEIPENERNELIIIYNKDAKELRADKLLRETANGLTHYLEDYMGAEIPLEKKRKALMNLQADIYATATYLNNLLEEGKNE